MSLKSWKFWLGIIISVIFLYLFIRGTEWSGLWFTLKSVKIEFLVLITAANLFSFVIRAIRWRYFFHLNQRKSLHFKPLFTSTAIGFMANTILPLRIGEIIRGVFLGQKEKISKSTCLGTLVVERLFDMLCILFFFAVYIIFYSLPLGTDVNQQEQLESIKYAGYVSGALCCIAIIVITSLKFRTEIMLNLIQWMIKPLPTNIRESLLAMIKSFISGLDILKDGMAFLISVTLTFAIWLILIFQTYLFFKVFSIELHFAHAIFLLVVMAFSVMVPAAPGYVGTFHYGTAVALVLLGVEQNMAKGVAIISHVFSMFPITILGLIVLWLENLSLLDLQKERLGESTASESE